MSHITVISALFLLLFTQSNAAPPQFDASFQWPLKLARQFSSGFGDIRPGRFHLGIDLRTGGQEGEKVYAPENGYVMRLKTSYTGYGKALYIKGISGRIYVFGHLQTYNWDIGTYLQKKQIESQRYYQDIYLPENDLPVKKGDFVARTGQTGAGAPHLHFEIRDAQDRPTNPLYYNIGLNDKSAPSFEAVWLTSLDDSTLFEDGRREISLDVRYDKKSRYYSVPDTISVSGRFAVVAAIEDFVKKGSFTLGPSRIRLFIDDKLYHEIDYDRIDFEENSYSILDRDHDPDKKGFKRVFNLYRKPGNRLTNYKSDVDGDGSFSDTTEGYHRVVIEAADAAGNSSRIEFAFYYFPAFEILEPFNRGDFSDSAITLIYSGAESRQMFDSVTLTLAGPVPTGDTPDVELFPVIQIGDNSLTIRGNFIQTTNYKLRFLKQGRSYPAYYFSTRQVLPQGNRAIDSLKTVITDKGVLFTAISTRPAINWLQAEIVTDAGSERRFFRKTGVNRFSLYYFPDENVNAIESIITRGPIGFLPDTTGFPIQRLRKAENSAIDLLPGCRLQADASCLFDDVLLTATDTTLPEPQSGSFIYGPFAVGPETVSFADWADLQVEIPEGSIDPNKIGLYVFDEDEGWLWAGGIYDSAAGILHSDLGGAGILAIISDTVGPEILALNIDENGRVKSNHPTIEFGLFDELSGIENDLNFDITIDDRYMIPEYDMERDILKTKPYWRLPDGRHTLKISVHDRCGNTVSVQRKFMVGARTGP